MCLQTAAENEYVGTYKIWGFFGFLWGLVLLAGCLVCFVLFFYFVGGQVGLFCC